MTDLLRSTDFLEVTFAREDNKPPRAHKIKMTTQTKIICSECNADFTTKQSFTKHITRYHPKHLNALQAPTRSTPVVQAPSSPAVQAPESSASLADPLLVGAATPDLPAPADPATAAPAPHHVQLPDDDEEELAMDSVSSEEKIIIDDDVMTEFENEMELYEQIEELSQAQIEAGKEDEMKAEIAEKLRRFKSIVEEKTKLVKKLHEQNTESQRQISMMKEVEKEQVKTITSMEKESKKTEKSTTKYEKTIENLETELTALREKNGTLVKEKTNLRIEVTEKDNYNRQPKETCPS